MLFKLRNVCPHILLSKYNNFSNPTPTISILLCNNNFHFDFNPKQKGEYSTTPSNVHDYKKQKSASDRKRKPKQTNKKQPHKKI